MKIFIKLATPATTAIRYEFVSDNNVNISLCPIPEFIGEIKCECGEPASLMVGESIYKCNTCIALYLGASKLKETTDVSIPVTVSSIKKLRFEWHGEKWDGDKWYNLWGNIIETNNWVSFVKAVKTMILTGKEVEFDGEYSQEPKRMTIY